jgi:hypothetical protein
MLPAISGDRMRPRNLIVDPSNPVAAARCDRCGFVWNHPKLQFQYQWTGDKLTNTNLLVCPPCYDRPNETMRTPKVDRDPVPIANARPETFEVPS